MVRKLLYYNVPIFKYAFKLHLTRIIEYLTKNIILG